MAETLNDLVLLTQDYVGNYSTGSVRTDVTYRAINRAIEYCKRQITLPNDEKIKTFFFSSDQLFYDLDSDFLEGLQLIYNNQDNNLREEAWEYFDYPNILKSTANLRQNKWSVTGINGKKQLVISGDNITHGQTLFQIENTTDWTATDDASGLATDSNIYHEGNASISFDITNSAGYATLTRSNLNLDLKALFDKHGYIKFWTYFTDSNISSISLKVINDATNYYTISTTLADDGTAYSQDEWQKQGFFTDNAIITGSPDPTAITSLEFTFNLGSGFTTAADFRIDDIFTAYPDKMDFIYLSNIKGTDSTGATNKTTLDNVTDILFYSGDYDDYTDLIAQKAALNLFPQLLGDKEQMMILKADFKANMKSFGRRYPRKRVQGTFKTSLRR